MAPTPHQALSIVLIIFYFPSLIPTSFLLHRHGIGKAWGWLYLFIFAIFRVTGASLQIAAESSQTVGLQIAAHTLASIGVMTLLLAMLEVLEDVKSTFPSDPIHPRIWTLMHLAQYAAFTLNIVSIIQGRRSLGAAASIIVACLFACQAAIWAVFYLRSRASADSPSATVDFQVRVQISSTDSDSILLKSEARGTNVTRNLLRLVLASMPFLTIRVIFMLLSTFVHSATFQGRDSDGDGYRDTPADVYVLAFVQYAMEFVAFALFLVAGVVMPSARKAKAIRRKKEEEGVMEMRNQAVGEA
ncbi:uncharacterized protein BDV14DRAFT_199889 [Aspergillus stella-maris]|uniref:uncharacterized protein n=1 Tax=Aspergillus stella-maris TaxID=1810926 RepID=UPI003CCDF823